MWGLSEVLVLGLATWQIVEVLHHGEIAASLRANAEASDGFWAHAFRCPFCLSHWVAGAVCLIATGLHLLASPQIETAIAAFGLWPIETFAVARLANLGNDSFRRVCRTPGHESE